MKMKNFFKQNKTSVIIALSLILVVISAVFIFIKGNERKDISDNSSLSTNIKQEESGETQIIGKNLNIKQEGGVTLTIGEDIIQFQLCQEDILKIHHIPEGKVSENTIMIEDKEWQEVKADYDLSSNPAVIKTSKMTIKIDTYTGSISIYDTQDKVIIKEFVINTGADTQIPDAAELLYEGEQNIYGISGYSNLDTSEGITRNKQSYTVMAGQQGYSGGPFVWTTAGYGLLIDSDGGEFSLIKDIYSVNGQESSLTTNKIVFENSSRLDKEAYLMIGNPTEIIGSLIKVTGQAPMFPKWAMGFTNSQFGSNQSSLIKIIDTYRSKIIPIDNFTLDYDWMAWGEDNYGESRWNETNFPDGPSGALTDLMASKGIKLTAILKPRIHVGTEQGKIVTNNNWWLTSKGFSTDYFTHNQVGDLDFSIEDAREWFFENVNKTWQLGMAGWWLDEADGNSPNLQFMNMQRALYEGYLGVSNERVWSINRNFYVGAQKYAYGMWSGDINTGFASMKEQRDRMLSAINVGQAKWGMDTGGFFGTPSPDNYARWMQFSALTPIFRVHGTYGELRQPWVYGEVAEKAAVKAINLRYKLIPYLYSYDRRAYEQGVGLVKPLVFDYPNDVNATNNVNSWMFGDFILASPVVEEGVSSVSIYLPQGKWIDYEKGTVYEGGQTINYKVDSSTWLDIPMFLKEGAIIPSQEVMNYVGEKPVDKIYVDIFPSTSMTEFKYYDDDGKTYDYEDGIYFAQNISQLEQDGGVKVNISKVDGSFQPETKYYILKVHGQFSGATLDGSEIIKASDEESLLAVDDECISEGLDVYGEYTVIKIKAGEEKEIDLLKRS